MANVITTEFIILAAYVLFLLVGVANFNTILTVLFVIGIVFPIVFYHHSWSFWLGFDYVLESLPMASES